MHEIEFWPQRLWVFAETADKELFYHNQTLVPDVHVAHRRPDPPKM